MKRTLVPWLVVLSGLALAAPAPFVVGQEGTGSQPARLTVYVPAEAQLTVDGIKTAQKGEKRTFESPPLTPGKRYVYSLKATWTEKGKEVSRQRDVRVEAGKETKVDLREEEAKEGARTDSTSPKKEPSDRPKRATTSGDRVPDVVWWPTPQPVVDKMLEMAKVTKDDVVYDPGCGDAIILVTAAKKYGCKCFGCDIDPNRIDDSMKNVKKNKVEDLVTIKNQDMFKLDFTPASVVTLYLLPDLNVKLMPQLAKCKPGTRIVSHNYAMKGAKPVKVETVRAVDHMGDESDHKVYLWIVPWEKE